MAKVLTAVAVRALRPTRQRREVRDGGAPGLYVTVQPSGGKSWCLRFRRPDGRPAKMTLGVVDLSGRELDGRPVVGQPLTLGAARQLAAEIHRQRAFGNDVVADHKTAKRRRRTEAEVQAANTFGQAVRHFIDGHAKTKTRQWRATARVLGSTSTGELIKGSLADIWADRPVTGIDSHDIYNVVEEARTRGVPGWATKKDGPSESRARHLFSALSTMFSWLHRHRRVEANPCAGVHRPDTPLSRDRVLADTEIRKFWAAASAEQQFGPALKLLLLSGCRLNEVGGLQRSELSDDGATWTIPGERTKNKRTHVVPLPALARQLIESVPNLGTDLVFTTTGTTPVSGWSKIKRRLDKEMDGVPPWRLHDLRRTAATGMAELGIAPHIVEAALNHISGAKAGVAGTYNRAAYAEQKRDALERWADHVERLVSGKTAKVVSLHPRRRT